MHQGRKQFERSRYLLTTMRPLFLEYASHSMNRLLALGLLHRSLGSQAADSSGGGDGDSRYVESVEITSSTNCPVVIKLAFWQES